MRLGKVPAFFALSFIMTACGTPSLEKQSQVRADINVPTEGIEGLDAETLKDASSGLSTFIVEGKSQARIADLADAMQLRPELMALVPAIVKAHPNPVQLECQGRRCRGISKGSAFSFVVDAVKIPLLGSPTITMADTIQIELQISADEQKLEICRLSGISTRLALVAGPVDGLAFSVSGDKIEKLVFDLGKGGTYPNNSCSF